MSRNVVSPSMFVSVLAWLLIVFSVLGILGALMQTAFVLLMSAGVFPYPLPTAPGMPAVPTFLVVFPLLALALAAFMVYAGFALLKRRNWARRTFIVLFALGIAFNVLWTLGLLAGVGLGHVWSIGANPPPAAFRSFFTVMMGFVAVWCLLISGLFGWLIWRLRAAPIRAEFIANQTVL